MLLEYSLKKLHTWIIILITEKNFTHYEIAIKLVFLISVYDIMTYNTNSNQFIAKVLALFIFAISTNKARLLNA
jgi:hypothetical protein